MVLAVSGVASGRIAAGLDADSPLAAGHGRIAARDGHRLIRLDPSGSAGWSEVARSAKTVMPDATDTACSVMRSRPRA